MTDRYSVIGKAYDVAASPSEYDALMDEWGAYLSEREGQLAPDITSRPSEADELEEPELRDHFARAITLLQRIATSRKPETVEDLIRDEVQPALVLDTKGSVVARGGPASALLEGAKSFTDLINSMRDDDQGRLREVIARAERLGPAAPPTVILMESAEGTPLHLAAIPIAFGTPVKTAIILRPLTPKWSQDLAAVMAKVFGLTQRECEIVEGLCREDSISTLAKSSGRSSHTVRTQVKSILAKTGASSQTALIRIVSGLSALTLNDSSVRDARVDFGNRRPVILPDGRWLEVHLHGPENGRPVVFVHGMLDGIGISKAVSKMLDARGIRLIAPVRSSFGLSDPIQDIPSAPQLFAQDLRQVLDSYGVERAPVLGHMAGAVYAFAAATYAPDRISAVVNVAGGIPITTRRQFQLMSTRQKVVALTARYTPSLLPMIVNGGITQIRSGLERHFMEALYKDAPLDLDLARREDVFPLLAAGYRFTVEQGAAAFMTDAAHVTRDWSELVRDVDCPVWLIHGTHDPVVRSETVHAFCATHSKFRLKTYDDAGQLLFYQAPERVLDVLESTWKNAGR